MAKKDELKRRRSLVRTHGTCPNCGSQMQLSADYASVECPNCGHSISWSDFELSIAAQFEKETDNQADMDNPILTEAELDEPAALPAVPPETQARPRSLEAPQSPIVDLLGKVPVKPWDRVASEAQMQISVFPQSYYYAFPVRTKGGGKSWIVGPSIGLLQLLADLRGGIAREVVKFEETDDSWIFYVRAIDLATGTLVSRVYRFAKPKEPVGSFDRERWMQMQFQAAVSKAERSILSALIPRGLQDYLAHQALEFAQRQKSEDLSDARDEIVARAKRLGLTVEYLEGLVKRKRAKWGAPELAILENYIMQLEDEARERGELTVEGEGNEGQPE